MANEAKKAEPRDKTATLAQQKYRVTNVAHFINNTLQPVGAIVQLQAGVKPGKYLVAVDDAGEPLKPASPDKGKKAE